MDFIMKNAAVLSAIIATGIGVMTFITNLFLNLSRGRYEENNNFQKSITDKLEKIYNPLIKKTKNLASQKYFIDTDIEALLERYGYLLSISLFEDFMNLLEKEVTLKKLLKYEFTNNTSLTSVLGDNQNKEKVKDLSNLRNKIQRDLEKEFKELKSYNESSFNKYKIKIGKSALEIIKNRITIIFFFISLPAWLFVVIIFYLAWIKENYNFMGNVYVDGFYFIYLFIVLLTSLHFIVNLFGKTIEFLNNKLGRKRRRYKAKDYVPETGVYFCKLTKEYIYKEKYTIFDYPRFSNFTQKVRFIFSSEFLWEKSKDDKMST
ncbi:hypothetical protein [Paenibacillus pabuli]|uniref:hypothetical protein n=1 Tax=Paenibacillus pabuli TaxID=1472 RepID=UPI001FFF81E5|nr:hypothetical protein [Paenibacillus pabuli]UPK41781.1 hypothetical protein KET34_21370 [Paenibacillus pabuli]